MRCMESGGERTKSAGELWGASLGYARDLRWEKFQGVYGSDYS